MFQFGRSDHVVPELAPFVAGQERVDQVVALQEQPHTGPGQTGVVELDERRDPSRGDLAIARLQAVHNIPGCQHLKGLDRVSRHSYGFNASWHPKDRLM
ncbi:hypothetical protein GCM10018953_59310 [Streptosporangium nondiastaticum]